jgi:O-antigen/teichoic acid export membrane protein
MSKTFFSNIILLVLLNLLIKPFYILGIDAEVQNQVGAEDYGVYFALLNFTFLFNILLDFGVTNYNTRNIARNPNVLSSYLGTILGLRIGLFLFYTFVTLGFGFLIGYSDKQIELVSILILNQFFVSILLYLRSNFTGLHWFKTDALFSVLDRILLITICSWLLWGQTSLGAFKIQWFVWAQTFAYGFSVFLALFITFYKHGLRQPRIKPLKSYIILRQSFPYALLILLMMIYNRMDSVMLERIHPSGSIEAGIYAQGYRFLDAVNMFALLFAGLLLPLFSRMLAKKEAISKLLTQSSSSLLSISTIVVIGCVFYAESIIALRYTSHIEESTKTFSLLIVSFIPVCITYIYGTALTANGNLKRLNQMSFIGVLLNLILNSFFIIQWGAWGAALATLITQSITALIQLLLAYKLLHLTFNKKAFLKYLFFLLLCITLFSIGNLFSPGILGLLTLSILLMTIALLMGAIPVKAMLSKRFED